MKKIIYIILCCLFSACAGSGTTSQNSSAQNDAKLKSEWMRDGSIVISRPVPEVIQNESDVLQNMLGFLPQNGSIVGNWIKIDRAQSTLTLMSGENTVKTIKLDASNQIDKLKAGEYKLLHKQRNPLWYAPDSYFTMRNLAVPSANDRQRYRRGALGEYALFIKKDMPIHTGPFWSSDIGGIKLDTQTLADLYFAIEIGDSIKIE